MWYRPFTNVSSLAYLFHALMDPGVSGVRSMGPVVSNWQTERGFWNLTDVTLADEDTIPNTNW